MSWLGRLRVAPSWRHVVAACTVTAFVAADAAAGSFQHQYEQAIRYGQAHWDAGLLPLSVDGMIVAATLVMWAAARKRKNWKQTWPAYLVLGIGVAVTVTINLSPGYPGWGVWLRPGISAWPAVAFVAAYEMTVWLVRMATEDPAVEGAQPEPEPMAGATPAEEPASPGPGVPRPVSSRAGGSVDPPSRPPGPRRKPRRRAEAGAGMKRIEAMDPEELRALVRRTGRNELARTLGIARGTADGLRERYAEVNGG